MVTTSAGSAASDPLGAARQILARTDSLATPADAAGVAALWEAICRIEEALAALPLQTADSALPARLAERCERLRARLLRIGGEPAAQAALADSCRSELMHLEERAAALIADTLEPTEGLVPRLRLTASRAEWLHALLARQEGAPAADPIEEARAEIDQTLAAARATDPHGEIAAAAERLAARAFALHARRLAAHADRLTAAPGDCCSLIELLRRLGEARLTLARAPWPAAADPERVQTDRLLHERAERAARALSARLAAATPQEASACLADWARELDERARELLLAADEVPPGTAARQMARMSEEIRAFLELAAAREGAGSGGRRRRHSPVARTLLRTERRLQNEHQERLLHHRLERMLGRRGVSALENSVLALILAVVGILLYEAIGRPSPEVRTLLMWVDTAICAVFLADFLLRLALAPCRGRYLRRHLLVDLLPSIPYGLVAHGLERLNLLRGVRLLRFLRLPRLLRYVRLARPLVQMVRVVIFLVRGTDRLVQRHASSLNRNVIVFEPRRTAPPPPPRERLRLLASRCRSRERELRRECDPELCQALIRRALAELVARLEAAPEWAVGDAGAVPRDSEDRPKREARLEEIIAFLTHLEAAQVEATVGIEFARRTARALRLFQAPLLRHIPPFSTLARIGARAADPLQATAALGRAAGRLAERALGAIHWFADLSGTVTAPQFLEMIGAALVRTATRPARRLITIGGGFLLLDWTFALFRFTWLRQLSQPLERVVGLPLFLLGGACLVALLLGQWFRRVASEASDFYERTAEAHFLALMEDVKEANAGEDLRVVHERVLWPEERLLARTPLQEGAAPEAVDRLLRRLAEAVPVSGAPRADAPPATILPEHADGAYYWLLEDRVLAMFRDYLDGALLHKSDTKSTNQLLGNLNVHRIVHERLALGRRERQRLQRLDLDRHRGLLGGPHLWFWFIAHSVAQRTAKLLIEYNRFALALDEVRFVDEARRAAFEAWLARAPQSRKAALCGPEGTYVSTEFTALSFLSVEPRRDRALAERYGARVLDRLQQDRRMLIRTLFGTYPLHRRPREQRTFNPYHYYQRRLAGGLILVYPLRVAWWGAGRAARGGATLLRVARELLNPERVEEQANNEAGFDVAERKIARMRLPVFMEVMRLRSLFDVEYLGLTLPGESRCPAEAVGCGHDLDWVGAGGADRDAFQQLRTDRHNALRRLAGMLEELALSEARLPAYLDGLRPGLGRRAREARRAAVIAYVIDYHGLRSFLTGQEEIESIWAGPIENPELLAGFGICRRAAAFVSSLPRRRFGLRRDPRRTEFDRVLARSRFAGASRRQRALLYRSVQADLDGVARRVRALGSTDDADDARRRARRILDEVLARPHPWTDELVVLRMIQTMAILDIRNYRSLVHKLGAYDEPLPSGE